MSFRCELCNKAQDAGTSPVVIVTEQRRVSYSQRMKGKKVFDPGGSGLETVSEVKACPKCAKTDAEESESKSE